MVLKHIANLVRVWSWLRGLVHEAINPPNPEKVGMPVEHREPAVTWAESLTEIIEHHDHPNGDKATNKRF